MSFYHIRIFTVVSSISHRIVVWNFLINFFYQAQITILCEFQIDLSFFLFSFFKELPYCLFLLLFRLARRKIRFLRASDTVCFSFDEAESFKDTKRGKHARHFIYDRFFFDSHVTFRDAGWKGRSFSRELAFSVLSNFDQDRPRITIVDTLI